MDFDRVLSKIKSYIHNAKHLQLIEDAFRFSMDLHEGQFRRSGEPYIIHPIAVAEILADMHAGPYTICGGLLHDVIEDTIVTKEEIAAKFGNELADIIDGVTKISKIHFVSEEKQMASNHRKMLLAMSKDIRVVIVKLADRLHNMRTLQHLPMEKQKRIARETLEIYAPLAHRLGMQKIKAELEDISLKYLNNDQYQSIKENLSVTQDQRVSYVTAMQVALKDVLEAKGVKSISITNRIKNIYSINKKMASKNKSFDEIYDLLAIRIIVDSIEDCYRALGIIHSSWVPIPNRFKDYIAMPKPNMYQSLHTTVLGTGGHIFEIQIRTNEMDEIAELGVAAHWTYKEGRTDNLEEQESIARKLKWYQEFKEKALVEESEAELDVEEDFVGGLKTDIFGANVYVFTPNGDVFDFPNGATPLDFAYRIHTEVGHKSTGAIINGKICPINYILQTGDIVEIKKGKDYTVNDSWLNIVKTTAARGKIRAYLNKRDSELYLEKGQRTLEKAMSKAAIKEKLTDKMVQDALSRTGINTLEKLYIGVGKGRVKADKVIEKLFSADSQVTDEDIIKFYNERHQVKHASENGVIVYGVTKAKIHISKCCLPVKGDEIIGYVSKDKGVTIHRKDCVNIKTLEGERLIEVAWDENSNVSFTSIIRVINIDTQGVLAKIVNTVSNKGLNVVSLHSSSNSRQEAITTIEFNVRQKEQIEDLMGIIHSIREVVSVERVQG